MSVPVPVEENESSGATTDQIGVLTRREREVLELIASGRTNRQIAGMLTISLPTAERHVHNILGKLGCANRTEAAAFARAALQDWSALRASANVAETNGASGQCPYPGLRPFDADDAATFFGREEAVQRLLTRLESGRIVSVVGASGSGKSSLVRAGLVPALKRGALPGSQSWEIAVMTSGEEPLAELASKLAGLTSTSALSVLRELESDTRALDMSVRDLTPEGEDDFRLVLVVDQFEEVFTMCRERAQQEQFVKLLLKAIEKPGGRMMLVLALRADLYGECAGFPGFAEVLERSHVLLGPPSQEELMAAVEGPAEQAGLRLEPGLCDVILRDLGEAPGALPLLSHALRETWLRRTGNLLTVAAYRASGGIAGAIAQTAERVYSGFDPAEQDACRNLFVRLTELGDGTEDSRRRVRFDEILPENGKRERAVQLVQRLAEARLITTGADSVEVAHEAIIREWPRLRDWLEEDREGYRILRHLTESAHAWDGSGRDDAELYRGGRLESARQLVSRKEVDLTVPEHEFLTASQSLQDGETRQAAIRLRRLRILVSALAVLFVGAAVVGVVALAQRSRANAERDRAELATAEAEAQRQAADAAVIEAILSRLETEIPQLLKSDRSLAFVLAAQAHNLQPGPRSDALMNVVLGDDPRYLGRIWPSEGTLAGYDVSPDGKYLALRNTRGLLELYDATTRALIQSIQGDPATLGSSPSFLPDGKSITSVSYDAARQHGTLVVRDVPTLAELRRFEFPAARGVAASRSLAPDGRLPVVVNGVLHLLELNNGRDRTVSELPQLVAGVRYDPRGRYLAAQPVSPRDTLGLFDASTFKLLRTFPQQSISFAIFGFTPDGNLLIAHFRPGDDAIELWNPETGELLASAPKGEGMPPSFDFDSTGARVAVATAFQELGFLSLPGLDAIGLPFPLLTVNFPFPKFGAGDSIIYNHALAYALEHWDLSGVGPVSSYTPAAGPGEIGFAPDGRWFVKQSLDGHWSRWRLPGLTLIDRSATSAGETTLPVPVGPAADRSRSQRRWEVLRDGTFRLPAREAGGLRGFRGDLGDGDRPGAWSADPRSQRTIRESARRRRAYRPSIPSRPAAARDSRHGKPHDHCNVGKWEPPRPCLVHDDQH
jgi:DNA-binding CsgD family transcriptional regulator/WD40 repeat protein